jgi:UDP:flavonoid glycosyltransferase YjiC (YdhE family)
VYVTLATVFNQVRGLLATMAEGAATHDVALLETTVRNADPDALGPLPSNVRVERHVPQTLVLPQCQLFVCHRGRQSLDRHATYIVATFVAGASR